MILLAGVFSLLFASLVLLIVLGASAFSQFNTVGNALASAFDSVLVTLDQVTSSILQSLQAFANTAIQVFKSASASIGSTFTNITDFLQDQFASTIQNVGDTAIRLTAQVTRSIGGGLIGSANAAVQLLQAFQQIFLQVTQLIAVSVVSATAVIFSAISAGINFLLRLVVGIMACVFNPIICGLNCMSNIFGIVFCGICHACCALPFHCGLSDLSGPSCCGVSGCQHQPSCSGSNVCNTGAFGEIPFVNAPCLFGTFSCPGFCGGGPPM
jgi:hypothetical protein